MSAGQRSKTEVKRAVDEVAVYQQLHQDRPGFFDTAINTGETSKHSRSCSVMCGFCCRERDMN